jgi:hypothetical protein
MTIVSVSAMELAPFAPFCCVKRLRAAAVRLAVLIACLSPSLDLSLANVVRYVSLLASRDR